MEYITLTETNLDSEHICCAFSDKKCTHSYDLKKRWLKQEFDNGYVFRRLDERAKVFIEYGPAEKAWVPVTAPNYMMLGCFWVSGKYKKQGHGKALLEDVIEVAKKQGKKGLVAVVGAKKFHFMSDAKWYLNQGFEVCDTLPSGFVLVSLNFASDDIRPSFNSCAKEGKLPKRKGCVVYFSNRCPYSEYHVNESLVESCENRGLSLEVIKIKTMEQAQSAPTPATIFSLYIDGEFITTDISVCMNSRFDKVVGKSKG